MKVILFEWKEGLFISLRAIRANKIRAVLTTLGIIIGVTSVILMSTALTGIDTTFKNGVALMGSDNLYIDKWAWFNRDTPWWELRNRKNITMEDYNEYESVAELPLSVSPSVRSRETIKFNDLSMEFTAVIGTNDKYTSTTNLILEDGRFFNEVEADGGRDVAIVGANVAEKLFQNANGVDNYIEIGSYKFKVLGVLEKQGSNMFGDFNPDNQVIIPVKTIFKYFKNEAESTVTVTIRAAGSGVVEATKDEAISIMRKVRGLKYYEEDDFSVNQQEGLLNEINTVMNVIQIAGYFITSLALFVGAIGIMNIMFVSVKERTREIGVRKAIVAKRRAILGQFIFESSIICLIGGIIGLGIALLLSLIVNQFIPTEVQPNAVIIAIVISLMTGAVSGIAPAYTAAKLDPVEALRYE